MIPSDDTEPVLSLLFNQCYLWKSSVIPYVAMVWKTVVNIAQFAFFNVLFDRV